MYVFVTPFEILFNASLPNARARVALCFASVASLALGHLYKIVAKELKHLIQGAPTITSQKLTI